MIAREGILFILIGLVLSGSFILLAAKLDSKILFILSIIATLLTLFTTYFFRDPNRQIPVDKNILVSPADGKIIAIDTVSNEFVGNNTIKVAIFLNVFDVHINRVPATGVIDYVKYNPGKFFAAFEDKASDQNEQTEIGMTSTAGYKLMYKQIAGLIARRIVCNLSENDNVVAGERFGIIRFGSRTELFVPAGSQIDVQVGDRVKGGSSVIGFLPKAIDSTSTQTAERGNNVEL